MKIKKYIFNAVAIIAILPGFTSCEVDNMDAPNCHITGRMIYNGQPIGVECESTSTQDTKTMLELWQDDFGASTAQRINVAQDGSFSTYVYPGRCRIITKQGVGPWAMADTLYIDAKKDANVDYDITPYFIITNLEHSISADNVLTVKFKVVGVAEGAVLNNAGIVVGNTRFVDLTYNKVSSKNSPQAGDLIYTIDLNSLKDCKKLYCRAFALAKGAGGATYTSEPFEIW